MMSFVVTLVVTLLTHRPQSGYDGPYAGGEYWPRTNQLESAAAGCGFPSQYPCSYVGLTGKAESSWSSAPYSTRVQEERCS